jgi:signal transduction histidine kinase/ActR/RegA family two-component response regulator
VVLSVVAVYQHTRQQAVATEQALQDAARALVVALDKHLDATITALGVLGTSDRLDAGDLAAFHAQCRRALGVREEWRVISLFDATGRRLLVTSEPVGTALPPPPAPMSEPFRRLVETRAPNVSDLFRSPLTQEPVISVGVPVVRDGATRWVLSAGLTQTALGRLLATPRVLPEWTGIVLDRRQVIVAQSHGPDRVGHPAPPALAGASAATVEGTVRDADAIALTVFSRSPTFGWTVAIAVPVTAGVFDAPVRMILAAGLGMLLVGVGVALLTGRRISRPMERLATAVGRPDTEPIAEAASSRVAEIAALGAALGEAARDRVRVQAEMAGYAERLRILHEIDQALIAAPAPVAVAEAALRRLRPLIGSPRAVVTLFDVAAGEGEWLAVDAATPSAVGAGVRFPLAMMGDLDALARGEVQVIEDVSALAHLPQARALLAEGVHAYIVIPLIADGVLVGSLNFGAGAAGRFPPEAVATAREVAVQLALVVQQARLHERVTRHAEELEVRVAERTAAATRANQAKSDFLSRMSHELRTPLNSILGFGQILEMETLGERQRECVERILTAGRHLLGLINEMLEISRIEAGRLSLSLEPVPLQATVAGAMDLVAPLAAQRRVALQMDVPDARRHVLADRQRLQQVLLNLLSNAVKYNRENGRVTVSTAAAADGRVRIRVTDTGPGIPAEHQARLFTPFERLGADATGEEGTGLGLTLSRHLVEAMDGLLHVESEVGVGSTFAVDLWIVDAPAAELAAPAPSSAMSAGPGGLVLYVEDNLSNFRLVERLLERRPATRLLSAIQGRRGLELAREQRPALILLDLHLPDLSGEEVLRRLQEDPATREIPVAILTADATPGQADRLLAAGARAHLTKPIEVRRLLALLDEHLANGGR